MIRHQVPAGAAGMELSRYLRRAWPLAPDYALRALLKRRDVRIDGSRAGKGAQLRGGEWLEIYADERRLAPDVELLFDDGRLMAAVKPQGLPSLPDRDGVGADTMQSRLERARSGARLCHRLDAATGGVMLAAADADVEAALLAAFRAHALRKRYRALLCGRAPEGERTYRAQLQKDARRGVVRVTDAPAPGSKEIVTRLRPLGPAGAGRFWAELEPVTGRTHQLRAHMAQLGMPILGDDRYGAREINKKMGFAGRLCLWCEEMALPEGCGVSGYEGMRFRAEPPEWIK